jgi:serine/threonine protein kinase
MYPDSMATYRVYMPPAEFGDGLNFVGKWRRDNLGDRLEETANVESVPATFLLDMLAAMLTGGQHMHSRNVQHNDIKLGNILFVADTEMLPMVDFVHRDPADNIDVGGWLADQYANDAMNSDGWGIRPVFTDFGLSMPEQSTAFTNPEDLLWGTPGTIPPEQVRNPQPPQPGS